MRARPIASVVLLALAPALANPALAQTAPVAEKEAAKDEEQEKKAEPKKPPKPPNVPGTTLAITGSSLMGLGGATLMAAGITWIIAASDASRLDDDCPNKQCVEGTWGADRLERARDAERASDILLGIGAPIMATGFVLLVMAAGLSRGDMRTVVTPVASKRGGGGAVGVRF